MLTANYYSALFFQLTDRKANTIPALVFKNYDGTISHGNIDGNTKINLFPRSIYSSMTSDSLIFGSNDTPENILDYTLTPVGGFSFTTGGITWSYDEENKRATGTRRYIINNTRSTPTIIKEFGITATAGNNGILIYRGVTDFTIEAGETVNFDLTVTYELPADFEPYTN